MKVKSVSYLHRIRQFFRNDPGISTGSVTGDNFNMFIIFQPWHVSVSPSLPSNKVTGLWLCSSTIIVPYVFLFLYAKSSTPITSPTAGSPRASYLFISKRITVSPLILIPNALQIREQPSQLVSRANVQIKSAQRSVNLLYVFKNPLKDSAMVETSHSSFVQLYSCALISSLTHLPKNGKVLYFSVISSMILVR